VAEKKLPDLKEFIDSINNAKKEERSGKKVRFVFVNRKRK
jgi:hypothetical protein